MGQRSRLGQWLAGIVVVPLLVVSAPGALAAKHEAPDEQRVDQLLIARFEAPDADARGALDDSIWARVVASSTPVVAYAVTDTTPPLSLGFEMGTLHRDANFVDVISRKGEFARDSALQSAHVEYDSDSRAKRFDCAHRTLELERVNRRAEQYDSNSTIQPIERGSNDEIELDVVCRTTELVPALDRTPASIWVDVSEPHSADRVEIAPSVRYSSADDPQATFVLSRMTTKARQTRWGLDAEATWVGLDCGKREWRQLTASGFARGKIVAIDKSKPWMPIQLETPQSRMLATVCRGD